MLDVLTVSEYQSGGATKKRWTKIGVAFENKNGGYTVKLDAMPLSGELVLKESDRDGKSDGDKVPF